MVGLLVLDELHVVIRQLHGQRRRAPGNAEPQRVLLIHEVSIRNVPFDPEESMVSNRQEVSASSLLVPKRRAERWTVTLDNAPKFSQQGRSKSRAAKDWLALPGPCR